MDSQPNSAIENGLTAQFTSSVTPMPHQSTELYLAVNKADQSGRLRIHETRLQQLIHRYPRRERTIIE